MEIPSRIPSISLAVNNNILQAPTLNKTPILLNQIQAKGTADNQVSVEAECQ